MHDTSHRRAADAHVSSRRAALGMIACGVGAALVAAPRIRAEPFRVIPQKASARVIVDNDFAGDPDGLVALAHQLLAPKTRTVLVTSTTVDPKLATDVPPDRAAGAGREIALELIGRLGVHAPPPVIAGQEISESAAASASTAARAIVAEALREDPLPLYFTCGGPLTNLAAALRLEPAIASRMTVVWIGGAAYPDGGWEYNLATDPDAARRVIEDSTVPLWQVPQNAYRQMQVSIPELTADLRPISAFTRWLYERFTSPPAWVELGGAWPLGDSPLVLLTAISTESSRFRELRARRIGPDLRYGAEIPGRVIRVYETIDARLAWSDLLARLRLAAPE
jgi:hypothetical protein